ncbi:DUF6473 family protein [Pseudooceanicola sp. MF1-13]|uniref:DUF6473 family protein n=1 Tax=Pseudooceanicola sp. MF1-13 TaxID=3379095 RepID=UPI003891D07A
MTCDHIGRRPINYMPCRYGTSQISFRGPKPDLRAPYVLFMGGTETYGKFVISPYPNQTARQLGLSAVNLGVCNTGPDLYLNEPTLTAFSRNAKATVVQLTSIQNLTNRYFSVHPRRNDRFVQAAELLRTIYRDVEFSEFHFTGHLMHHLHHIDPKRFDILKVELQQAWCARMKALILTLSGPVVLLNLTGLPDALGLLPTDQMIQDLRPLVHDILDAPVSPAARDEGTDRMIHAPLEKAAAEQLLSQRGHDELAEALATKLRPFVPQSDQSIPAE